MSKKVAAMILAGGAGTRLDILSSHRAKPAVVFGGKYRIIDFALSNCVNSNISIVGILTQYLPMSLNEHVGIGRHWDLDRNRGGLTMLPPFQREGSDWYNGTANAIYQNLSYIAGQDVDYVLVLAGDHIYKMDYQKMIRKHERTNADVTIAVKEVDMSIASQFGILSVDHDSVITEFQEKPKKPKSNLASMGIYIFNKEILMKMLLRHCGPNGGEDFGKHIIPEMIGKDKVVAYKYSGYWRDVGTLEQYWKANIELAQDYPPVDLYDNSWKIYTKSEELPPVKFGEDGAAKNSLISNGCVINGTVTNSVISPGVKIEEGAVVKDSIILNDTVIKKDSIVERTIIDKNVVVGKNCRIGLGDETIPNIEVPHKMYTGLNLIGKFAMIPEGTYIERNCRIMSRVEEDDYSSKRVRSGETVHSKEEDSLFSRFLLSGRSRENFEKLK